MNPANFFVALARGEFSAPVKYREDHLAVLDYNGKLIAEFETRQECLSFVESLVAIGRKLLARKRKKEGL